MSLFESMLTLMLAAIVLLQLSRHLAVPYPTMLAVAGVGVAALPWAPRIAIEPHLALALFVAPALLDAAFDFAPRELRRHWAPLFALAAVAVLLTTAAVATLSVWWGLPLAAGIALGAIVAPPDAAAATTILRQVNLPRTTTLVLQGESLLNDAAALLIFSAAVAMATTGDGLAGLAPWLLLAPVGGVIGGALAGAAYVGILPLLAGTLGGTLFEFVSTFGVWIVAERAGLSPILAVVAFAMMVARGAPERHSPRDRVRSYSVWEAVVFLLNVTAFLLMGLQSREIVSRLPANELWEAALFALAVFVVVVVVRFAWVMGYGALARLVARWRGRGPKPTVAQGIAVSWCGMRGLVTLATALALPPGFPERDLIALAAFATVLGTLVGQGLTLAPLIRLLRFERDGAYEEELTKARLELLDAGDAALGEGDGEAARWLRREFAASRTAAEAGRHPRAEGDADELRRAVLAAKRRRLMELRRRGEIGDDVFHALEEELDWAELAASPPDRFQALEV